MSACTRNSSRGFYTRLTWTSALVLFIMCLALSELRCEVSADPEVDADLVFDLDDPVVRDQETKSNGQDHRRFEKRHARRTFEKAFSVSSAESQEQHETEESHWLTKAVHRIKRGFLDWLTPPKKVVEEVKPEDKSTSREKRNSEEKTETTDDYDTTTKGQHHEEQHSFEEEEGQHDYNEVDDTVSNHGGDTSLDQVLPANRGDSRDQTDDEDFIESGSTTSSTPRAHPLPSPETAQYYRVSLTINEPYTPSYEVKTSPEFVNLATSVSIAITQLYEDLPGQRHVNVVKIKKREIDSFTSLALVDIGTRDYYNGDTIKNRLYDQIQNYQRLGDIPVSTEEFTFTKFVEPQSRCKADELQCNSGECVHVQFRCDGVEQCSDGTDEMGCPTVTTPKHSLNEIDPDAEDDEDYYDGELTENPTFPSFTTEKSHSVSHTTEHTKHTPDLSASGSSHGVYDEHDLEFEKSHNTHISPHHSESTTESLHHYNPIDSSISSNNNHQTSHTFSHNASSHNHFSSHVNNSENKKHSGTISPPLLHYPSLNSTQHSVNSHGGSNDHETTSTDTEEDIHSHYNPSINSHNSHSHETNNPEEETHFGTNTSSSHSSFNKTYTHHSINPQGGLSSASQNNTTHQEEHSKETFHNETNKHKETEFHNTFNFTVDLGGDSVHRFNRTVTVNPEHQSNSSHLNIPLVPAISSIAEPVTAPTRQDRCRADDKFKCADGSIICDDQKCDGEFDCPDHDDEDNCSFEGTTCLYDCDLSNILIRFFYFVKCLAMRWWVIVIYI